MTPPFSPIAYFNQEFVPFGEANVSVATHALQYGSGVFGGIRGYLSTDETHTSLFRLADHAKRFRQSASLLGISLPLDDQQLAETIITLVEKNKVKQDFYIRPYAYKAGLDMPPGMHGVADGLAIYMLPMGRIYDKNSTGLSVSVSSWRRIEDTAIPARGKIAGAYVNSSLAKDEAVVNGFDDAILLNENGSVAEASTCNIFVVRDGVLVTPPVSDNILEGITRRSVLQLAADLSIPTMERSVDRSELYVADEVIFCGTAVELSWVSQIDNRMVADGRVGRVFTSLQQQFSEILRGTSSHHAEWLTTVTL